MKATNQNQRARLIDHASFHVIQALGVALIAEQSRAGRTTRGNEETAPKHPVAGDYLMVASDTRAHTTGSRITRPILSNTELGVGISICKSLSVKGLEKRLERLASLDHAVAKSAAFEIVCAGRLAANLAPASVVLVDEADAPVGQKCPDIVIPAWDMAFDCKEQSGSSKAMRQAKHEWSVLWNRARRLLRKSGVDSFQLEFITDGPPTRYDIEWALKSLDDLLRSANGPFGMAGEVDRGPYVRLHRVDLKFERTGIGAVERTKLARPIEEYDTGQVEMIMQVVHGSHVEQGYYAAKAFTMRTPVATEDWVSRMAAKANKQLKGFSHRVVLAEVHWPAYMRARSETYKQSILAGASRAALDRLPSIKGLVLVSREQDHQVPQLRHWHSLWRKPLSAEVMPIVEALGTPTTLEGLASLSTAAGVHRAGSRKGPCWCGSTKALKSCHGLYNFT